MRVVAIHDPQGLAALREAWESLVRPGRHILHTSEWVFCWLRHHAAGSELYALAVWDGPVLIGLLPLLRARVPGPLGSSRVLTVASGHMSEYLELVAPGREGDVARALALALAQCPQWDRAVLRRIPDDARLVDKLALELRNHGAWVQEVSPMRGCRLVLPGTYDDYLRRLSARTRRKWAKARLGLEHDGVTLERIDPDQDIGPALDDLMRLHQARWTSRGYAGKFADPTNRAFLHDVGAAMHRRGWARLLFLRLGAERIAADLSFFHPQARFAVGFEAGILPGVETKWSPGIILRSEAIRLAIQEGMDVYDERMGIEPYKLAFRPRTICYRALMIAAPRVRPVLTQGLEMVGIGLRKMLHVLKSPATALEQTDGGPE